MNSTVLTKYKRLLYVSILSLLLWLLCDLILVKLSWQWGGRVADIAAWSLQYIVYLYSVDPIFQSKPRLLRWLLNISSALLVWIIFMLLLLPILLKFHTLIGGQL